MNWGNAISAAVLAIVTVSAASADVITVDLNGGSDYLTIQEGIDAADEGDTVLVADGTYTGANNRNLSFGGRNMTLRGVSYPTIDCHYEGRGLIFENGEGPTSVVDGLVICHCVATRGAGIRCLNSSSPTIMDCQIYSCEASSRGGGVQCLDSSPAFEGCNIYWNTAGTSGGGGVYCEGGTPSFVDCYIGWNWSDFNGANIYCDGSSPVISQCTLFLGEVHGYGGALWCTAGSAPVVSHCTIVDNNSDYGAGGIGCYESSSPVISNCIIAFNTAEGSGTGEPNAVYCLDPGFSHPVLMCCDVYGNQEGDWVQCIADQLGVDHNFSLDPKFCYGAAEIVYMIDASSPCAAANNAACGLIGAWDVGCDENPVETMSWGRLKALYRE